METIGLQSAGNVRFGTSLLSDRPFSIEEFSPPGAGTGDVYVGANASIAADHGSLKTPETTSHAAVTKQIEEITGNPALTDKQKRATINDLRKQLGLSKGDMKKIYTKPLERAYAQKIEELRASGVDTPEKARLLEQLEFKKSLYGSMYKTGGCVKKVFKGIGKGLATVGKVAVGAASAIANPMSLIPMGVSWLGKIPGVGKALNTVSGAISKATGYVESAVGKVRGWMDKGLGYVQRGVQFSKDLAALFGNF